MRLRRFVPYFLLLGIFTSVAGQDKTDPFLVGLLRSQASRALLHILDNADSFRYQLIYTRIDRDKNNKPHFKSYYYRSNPLEYFNPASTVKMPLAFLALEKVDSLSRYGVDKETPMFTDSAYSGQTTVHADSSASDGLPSLAQYIRKIFLVSDNDAYNRLYEFLGQETINRRLRQLGYRDIRITRRFVPMTEEENRNTNPIRFLRDSQILQSVLFPASVPVMRRFRLSAGDYRFLYRYLSEYPRESVSPPYDSATYFDGYTKFFFFRAGHTPVPSYIRSFNKPGWSYGFLTDIAYIADFTSKVEFMLSGTIYVNRDGVLNDDKYEYEETGWPFFKEIGTIIYRYELRRTRHYRPDLGQFRLSYGPMDGP